MTSCQDRKENAKRHLSTHLGYKYDSKMQSLTQTRHSEKLYSCKDCNENFNSESSLYRHILKHKGKKPKERPKNNNCKICERKYSSKRDLDNHTMKHSGEKPLKCDECEKTFTREYIGSVRP